MSEPVEDMDVDDGTENALRPVGDPTNTEVAKETVQPSSLGDQETGNTSPVPDVETECGRGSDDKEADTESGRGGDDVRVGHSPDTVPTKEEGSDTDSETESHDRNVTDVETGQTGNVDDEGSSVDTPSQPLLRNLLEELDNSDRMAETNWKAGKVRVLYCCS